MNFWKMKSRCFKKTLGRYIFLFRFHFVSCSVQNNPRQAYTCLVKNRFTKPQKDNVSCFSHKITNHTIRVRDHFFSHKKVKKNSTNALRIHFFLQFLRLSVLTSVHQEENLRKKSSLTYRTVYLYLVNPSEKSQRRNIFFFMEF